MAPRLIFLHGGPGYPDYLEPFFSKGFPANFETVFYSQLQADPIAIEDVVAELEQKVTAASNPVVLIGHSWGGALAAEYCQRKLTPQIRGIVLIGAFLCAEDATKEYHRELEIRGLESPTTEEVFLVPSEYKPAQALMERLKSSFNLRVFRALWEGFVGGFDARPFIQTSGIPVLNVFGEHDIRIPARKVREYAALSPAVRNFELRDTAHFPFIHERDRLQVIAEIVKFTESR